MGSVARAPALALVGFSGKRQAKLTPVGRETLFAKFDAKAPASHASVAQCQSRLKFRLPPDYVQFLEQMNGGEGFIGRNYLMAWSIEDLIQSNNDYQVEEYAPGLFYLARMAEERHLLSTLDPIHRRSSRLHGSSWI
jgi:hypothetical protein